MYGVMLAPHLFYNPWFSRIDGSWGLVLAPLEADISQIVDLDLDRARADSNFFFAIARVAVCKELLYRCPSECSLVLLSDPNLLGIEVVGCHLQLTGPNGPQYRLQFER